MQRHREGYISTSYIGDGHIYDNDIAIILLDYYKRKHFPQPISSISGEPMNWSIRKARSPRLHGVNSERQSRFNVSPQRP